MVHVAAGLGDLGGQVCKDKRSDSLKSRFPSGGGVGGIWVSHIPSPRLVFSFLKIEISRSGDTIRTQVSWGLWGVS